MGIPHWVHARVYLPGYMPVYTSQGVYLPYPPGCIPTIPTRVYLRVYIRPCIPQGVHPSVYTSGWVSLRRCTSGWVSLRRCTRGVEGGIYRVYLRLWRNREVYARVSLSGWEGYARFSLSGWEEYHRFNTFWSGMWAHHRGIRRGLGSSLLARVPDIPSDDQHYSHRFEQKVWVTGAV